MLKKWGTIMIMLLLLSGCAKSEKKFGKEFVDGKQYYNSYFGLSIVLNDDWVINYLNEDNLTENPGDTLLLDNFSQEDNGAGGYFVEMLFLSNTENENDNNHAQLMLYGEVAPDCTTLDDYISYYKNGYEGNYDDFIVTLNNEGNVTLGGQKFYMFRFDVTNFDTGRTYVEEYYMKAANEGFIVIYNNYWKDIAESKKAAKQMLELVTLES